MKSISEVVENNDSGKIDWLIELARSNESDFVRRSAIVGLRKLKVRKATPIFVSILATEMKNQNLRESALKALGEIGDENVVELLKAVEQNEAEVARFGRLAARNAIERILKRLSYKRIKRIAEDEKVFGWQNDVRNLIANNKIDEAIDVLAEKLKQLPFKRELNEIIIQKAKMRSINEKLRLGLITFEEELMVKTQISYGVLELNTFIGEKLINNN